MDEVSKASMHHELAYVRAMGEDFLIMDELAYHNLIYEGTSVLPHEELYALKSVFRMRSQIQAEKDAALCGRTRRKRKHNSRPIINVDPDFVELCKNVETRLRQIVIANVESFETPQHGVPEDENNERARLAVSRMETSIGSSAILHRISHRNESSLGDFHLTADNCVMDEPPDECRLWTNEASSSLILTCDHENFIIPPKCAFIVGDVLLSRHLIARGLLFDLIVMDPPWRNKSVKRKKSYTMFDEQELFELRIPELLHDSGLLAVWMTNNETMKRLMDDVIESFGLFKLATCHWVKVTTYGEPICKFQPHHKVPFETFVLACRKSYFDSYNSKIKQNFLLISTPSAIHSRKPPLVAVLKAMKLLDTGYSCLELYGRYLLPNTTTIGFEALKLQNLRYFKMR